MARSEAEKAAYRAQLPEGNPALRTCSCGSRCIFPVVAWSTWDREMAQCHDCGVLRVRVRTEVEIRDAIRRRVLGAAF
jgi:hypothetical protein